MTNPTIDPISYNAGIDACSFCRSADVNVFECEDETAGASIFWVECESCSARGPTSEYKDGAVIHWNARPEPQTAPTCICPRCSATIVGEMNGPEDELVTADAERLALADFGPGKDYDAEMHVRFLRAQGGGSSGYTADLIEKLYFALRAGGWREDMPPVSVGCEREFIVAVYRASSGKAYTFAASYLNAYPLQYEHECPKWKEGVGCSGEGCDDGCPTTGWFEQTGDDDYSSMYNRLELREGDIFLGWSELPKWNGPLPSSPHTDKND